MAQPAERQAVREPVLSVNNIEVVYDEVILVLRGVSLEVAQEIGRASCRERV